MSEPLPADTNKPKIEIDAQKKESNAQKKEKPLAQRPAETASDQ